MRHSDCWYKNVCVLDCDSLATCIRYAEMKFLMDNSNIPEARQLPEKINAPDCDYDAYTKLANIKRNIADFVSAGNNLYIASDTTGNGKTTWAIKLLLKYFDSVWAGNGFRVRGLFIHVPTFLLKCKDFGNRDEKFEELKNALCNVDLVVWDDIASTDVSAYDYSQLLMYIDNRTLNNKSNIYTGNYANRDRLLKRVGAKLTSRIWSDNTDIIIFKGGDMR